MRREKSKAIKAIITATAVIASSLAISFPTPNSNISTVSACEIGKNPVIQPIKPITPPTKQIGPIKPCEPANSNGPAKPGPVKPAEPPKPGPVKPDKPAKPEPPKPGKPADEKEKPSPKPARVPVDKNGLDSEGRMVSYFGSPEIDGEIDKVWKDAQVVKPQIVVGSVYASATFKSLWDDNAIYILAEVKDPNMSLESGTPYMQDSLEIFLDENNDKTQEYGSDDLHFRVNYNNVQTIDVGSGDRFYTASKKVKDGYIIEARISLKTKPENDKVLGIDLQINDALGTERLGTINMFDATGTAWNDATKFGEVLLTGKAKGAKSGLNPYDLKILINNIKQLDTTRYKNMEVVTEAIEIAEKVANNKKSTQEQIDEQIEALKLAISKLELTEEAANEKIFKVLPNEYREESKSQGTIETIEYNAPNLDNGTDVKRLNVYLPYGYNAEDTSKKYNVLYLMHGGGENENTIFGGPGQNKELKKIIDNMIEKGEIEPLIVVTPSFYGGKNDTPYFPEELVNIIIPLVETKYNTYTESTDTEDLIASREHRAFGGFSMGSVTTWYTFINCLDYFKYFMPLSGDCWIMGEKGGVKAQETAEYLANVVKESGYGPEDYYIFSATGDQDIAYPNLKPQIDAMKEYKDIFIYSGNLDKGNFYFIVAKDATHAWNWVNQYIYNILPDLFSNNIRKIY